MNNEDNIDEERASFLVDPWSMIILALSSERTSVSWDPKKNKHRRGKFKLGKEIMVPML